MIRSVGSSPWRMTVAVVIFILVLGGYMSAAGIVFAQDVKISVFVGANGKVNDNADDFVDVVSSEEDYKLEIIADDDYVIGSVLVNDESLEKMNSEGESIIGFPKGTLHIEKPGGDLDVVVAFKKAGSDTEISAGQQDGASAGSNSAAESGEGGSGSDANGSDNVAGSAGTGGSDNTAGAGDASGNDDAVGDSNDEAAVGSDDGSATGEGNVDSAGSEGNGDSAGSDDAAGSTDAGDGNEDTGSNDSAAGAGDEDTGSNDSAAGAGNEDAGSNDSATGETNGTAGNTDNTGKTVVLRDVGKNKTDGSGDAAGNDATETADGGSGKAGNSYQSPKTGDEGGSFLPEMLIMMALAAGTLAVVRRRHA